MGQEFKSKLSLVVVVPHEAVVKRWTMVESFRESWSGLEVPLSRRLTHMVTA
jgi:hypothetical protein